MNCFDCAEPDLVAAKAATLKANGIEYVILYINPGWLTDSKTVKKPHIDHLHAAGIGVAFVCELWGGSNNFSHNDITEATGERYGQVCSDYMKSLGAPAGTMCAPTVDNDVNAWHIANLALPHARGFRKTLDPQYTMGFYGPGALMFALEAENPKIVDWPWLANANGWSRSVEYRRTGRAAITQQRETNWLGLSIDPDVLAPGVEKAFWTGTASTTPADPWAPIVHDATWIQHALNVLKVAGTPLAEDGVIGTHSRAAVVAFQEANGLAPDGIVGPLTMAALVKATTT